MDIEKRMSFIPAWHDTGNCMDKRHILWVYELLMRMKPQRTLEIGGYSGCSSSAFVAAGIPDAHFAEIAPRRDFIEVVNGHGTIHARKGCEVLDYSDPFDVVLVDGSHEMEAVQEEYAALMRKPPKVIIAHDVNSAFVGFPLCEGPDWLFNTLAESGWDGEQDCQLRPFEMTHRGIAFFTKDQGLRDMILDAMTAAECL